MAGLEQILEEIKKENDEIIQKIKQEGEHIANEILKMKEDEIEERKKFFKKKFDRVIELDVEKGKSSAVSYRKKLVLEKKQELIRQIIEKTKEYIKNLEKDEYISFFQNIAVNQAHKEEGTIRLNKIDKERFASEFVEKINLKLSENNKGKLTLDDKVSLEKTGFVMVYGEIEENCSLEAIFSEKLEILSDKLNSFLFI